MSNLMTLFGGTDGVPPSLKKAEAGNHAETASGGTTDIVQILFGLPEPASDMIHPAIRGVKCWAVESGMIAWDACVTRVVA